MGGPFKLSDEKISFVFFGLGTKILIAMFMLPFTIILKKDHITERVIQ